MKIIYVLLLTILIASCTAGDKNEAKNTNNWTEVNNEETIIDDTLNEIVSELDKIDSEEEISEDKMVKIEAPYTNPETDVDMVINYSLNEDKTIKTIEITSTTYPLDEYNESVKTVIGKTIEEAKEADIAWGSLTNAAFKAALK